MDPETNARRNRILDWFVVIVLVAVICVIVSKQGTKTPQQSANNPQIVGGVYPVAMPPEVAKGFKRPDPNEQAKKALEATNKAPANAPQRPDSAKILKQYLATEEGLAKKPNQHEYGARGFQYAEYQDGGPWAITGMDILPDKNGDGTILIPRAYLVRQKAPVATVLPMPQWHGSSDGITDIKNPVFDKMGGLIATIMRGQNKTEVRWDLISYQPTVSGDWVGKRESLYNFASAYRSLLQQHPPEAVDPVGIDQDQIAIQGVYSWIRPTK